MMPVERDLRAKDFPANPEFWLNNQYGYSVVAALQFRALSG